MNSFPDTSPVLDRAGAREVFPAIPPFLSGSPSTKRIEVEAISPTLVELYAKHCAPVYLFDCDALEERVKAIQAVLPDNCTLCYAVKANPFLVRALSSDPSSVIASPEGSFATKEANLWQSHPPMKFEACSRGELELCLADGVPAAQIVFSGVMKTALDIRRALEAGVGTITLESIEHTRLLLEQSAITKHPAAVILRLTSGSQFGMSESDAEECLKLLSANPAVKVMGVHYFTGTQKRLKKTAEEISMISSWARSHGADLVEYGAGAYYEYYGDGDNASIHPFGRTSLAPARSRRLGNPDILDEIEKVSALMRAQDTKQWVLELGRYIAAPVGYYITRIMDIKDQFVICDGGINHVNYYGSMVGMKKPRVTHIKGGGYDSVGGGYGFEETRDTIFVQGSTQEGGKNHSTTGVQKYTIVGSLCTFNDVLVRSMELDNPAIGDYLVFADIGAYSITEGIYLFLSHPLPAVYEKHRGQVSIRRESIETYKLNH